jgi:hypothetical protein
VFLWLYVQRMALCYGYMFLSCQEAIQEEAATAATHTASVACLISYWEQELHAGGGGGHW